jgi:hypothetical protein
VGRIQKELKKQLARFWISKGNAGGISEFDFANKKQNLYYKSIYHETHARYKNDSF